MRRHLFRIFRLTLGLLFLVLGLIGLVVPILQGWLFLALAALTLSIDLPFLARFVERIEARWPGLAHPIQRLRRFLGKLGED
ncbi:MAG: hypothetical protein ACUVRZ_03275 [Desulfobacca sp.]|uniref:hypothetical protein n=1 Tax=Desulfobacca sp. TaxID=2067990 RepID=UPI00404AFA6C